MNRENIPRCPHCRAPGEPVPTVTVHSLITVEHAQGVTAEAFWACLAPDCGIAYFSQDGQEVLHPYQLKVPLHFKTGAHPQYACYCNKITEEDIHALVREKGLRDMPKIIRLLRDEVQSDCIHRNPLGRCCSERFHQVIDDALKNRG